MHLCWLLCLGIKSLSFILPPFVESRLKSRFHLRGPSPSPITLVLSELSKLMLFLSFPQNLSCTFPDYTIQGLGPMFTLSPRSAQSCRLVEGMSVLICISSECKCEYFCLPRAIRSLQSRVMLCSCLIPRAPHRVQAGHIGALRWYLLKRFSKFSYVWVRHWNHL